MAYNAAMQRLTLLLNVRAGARNKDQVVATLRDCCAVRGIATDIRLLSKPQMLEVELHRLLAEGATRVMVGGGDGTISTAANVLKHTPLALGVLPLGTFNYFARALGLPDDPAAALALLLDGEVRPYDLATVNGRAFLNNLSFGLYTGILKYRETYKARWGRSKLVALVSGVAAALWLHPLLKLQLNLDGRLLQKQTPLAFLGVNHFQLENWGLANPECHGRMTLLITRPVGRLGLIGMAMRSLFRSLGHGTNLESYCVDHLELTHRRRRMRVALDGEIIRLKAPLVVEIQRRALQLIYPSHPHA